MRLGQHLPDAPVKSRSVAERHFDLSRVTRQITRILENALRPSFKTLSPT